MPSGVYKHKLHTQEWKTNMSKLMKGRKFTQEWKNKISESHKGSKNPCWKNGIIKDGAGYIRISQPNHPFAPKHRPYVKRSRLVMEKHLGRLLKPEEIIHHINGIRTDDRIKNLVLCLNHSQHGKLHGRPKKS